VRGAIRSGYNAGSELSIQPIAPSRSDAAADSSPSGFHNPPRGVAQTRGAEPLGASTERDEHRHRERDDPRDEADGDAEPAAAGVGAG
jgi:hypothetical protein